jgi:hypothetical protein
MLKQIQKVGMLDASKISNYGVLIPYTEANNLRELLGIKDLRVVHTLLEIVVTWGLYPQLLQGVGLPLSQRIKSGYSNKGKE